MRLHTKQDYQRLLLDIVKPLKDKFTEEKAGIRICGAGACYPEKVIEMEGFARLLWGLVPFWAGGGREKEFEEIYRKGLVSGTDPKGEEYWGDCEDFDQRFVEMAPIALGLLMVPEVLWEPLTDEEKGHLASWLGQINSHELPECNWYYFRVLVNLALKERECSYDEGLMESDLEQIEEWYLGNGWYVDGASRQKDYYSAFAMEFYSQIYAVFGKAQDPKRCGRFKRQAKEFAGEYLYWFDNTGAALPFGRSLIYRFAQTAFWAGALFSGGNSVSAGAVKGIINRNVRYWLSGEIFQADQTLNVGYRYANLTMAERYNSPSSPYWALKTFLLLALPDEHPYWEAIEEPLPSLKPVFSIPKADMLIQHGKDQVCAYVPGFYNKNVLGHFVEKYGKFAYSTVFGFSISHSVESPAEAAPDSMLAFLFDEDSQGLEEKEPRVYVRRRSIDYKIETDRVWSKWSPAEGVLVETEIRMIPQGHIRRHVIWTERACSVYDCGFSVALFEEGYKTSMGKDWIQTENRIQCCRMSGREGGLVPCLINACPNTNVLYKNTVIPALFGKLEPGKTIIETVVEGDRNTKAGSKSS